MYLSEFCTLIMQSAQYEPFREGEGLNFLGGSKGRDPLWTSSSVVTEENNLC